MPSRKRTILMVTYTKLGKYGRLGNQMFQIASTIGIAYSNKIDYGFNDWNCNYSNINYNNFLKNPLKKTTFNNNLIQYKEVSFNYNPVVLDAKKSYDLSGYFQSEKYFNQCSDLIKEIFKLKPEHIKILQEKYPEILKENTCSLHIRRGDYVKLQSHHPLIELEYYYNALKLLYPNGYEDVYIFIFSDDIDWCKKNLKLNNKVIFVDSNIDILDLFLMSFCNNNIIANSSFSWWGAYLNENKEKKVIVPKKWFGEKNKHLRTEDIYCKNWIKL